MSQVHATTVSFNQVYNSTSVLSIPYNSNWSNGTGYYDGATKYILAPGKIVKSVSPVGNNRKMLLVGTRFGTVVVFERYTDGANGIFVNNWPEGSKANLVQKLVNATSALSSDTIEKIIGGRFSFDLNIGQWIEAMFAKEITSNNADSYNE